MSKEREGGNRRESARHLCFCLNSDFITSKMLQGINESNSANNSDVVFAGNG